MTAKEISSSISEREKAYHERFNAFVRQAVLVDEVGGINYQTYWLDMEMTINEGVKVLISTGAHHVFKLPNENDTSAFNRSLGQLEKFGAWG